MQGNHWMAGDTPAADPPAAPVNVIATGYGPKLRLITPRKSGMPGTSRLVYDHIPKGVRDLDAAVKAIEEHNASMERCRICGEQPSSNPAFADLHKYGPLDHDYTP